jgi:hypothetical protein
MHCVRISKNNWCLLEFNSGSLDAALLVRTSSGRGPKDLVKIIELLPRISMVHCLTKDTQ